MDTKLTRRKALAGISSTLLLPLVGHAQQRPWVPMSPNFRHGVASGDPDQESLIIWTRVSDVERPVQVDWQVAQDPLFKTVVSRGTVTASVSHDYTVKVLVASLEAGKSYYYRFHLQNGYSPEGRTRTLPKGDIDSLTLAVASCTNYPFGYFNAYEAIARDTTVDWVLHLGDYIYEYGPQGYGGDSGRALGRTHEPPRETVSLADYRQRHAQYKSDAQSQMMHAAHPLLLLWDDHELTNNPWRGGAQNHQPTTEGSWATRRDMALQAYFEWMPVRDPFPGQRREDYWRNWRFGSLASLVSLETRLSGRAIQIDYAKHADKLTDRAGVEQFLRDVVGAENRPMMSDRMQSFLRDSLLEARAAGRRWQLVANQIPMARTRHPRVAAASLEALRGTMSDKAFARFTKIARYGELELPLFLDHWDGYPAAREAFYQLCKDCKATDLVVLTGDSHSFWSNQLRDAAGNAMGVELGTTGISSPGPFTEFGPEGSALMDNSIIASNDEIVWTNGRHNGYLRLSLGRDTARADYLSVSTINKPKSTLSTLRSQPLIHSNNTVLFGQSG